MTNPESFRGCSNSESLREQAAELQARALHALKHDMPGEPNGEVALTLILRA